ncbi:MAG TPA: hypothetical protein VII47_02885 [Actinomycetota bacterium]
MDVREGLANRVDSGAAWRTEQSREHPEEESNRRSRDALTQLAGYVMTLPASDQRLEAIGRMTFSELAFSADGDDVDQLIARYGSNRRLQADPDAFIRDLVGIADRNAPVSRHGGQKNRVNEAGGQQPTRVEGPAPAPPSEERLKAWRSGHPGVLYPSRPWASRRRELEQNIFRCSIPQ